MNVFYEWRKQFRTPGIARIGAFVLLIAWALSAIWGWFFVEATVLRDSQAARDFVGFTTTIFPWLDRIKELGPRAEKAQFLQCVNYFAFAPIAIGNALLWEFDPRQQRHYLQSSKFKKFMRLIGIALFLIFVISLQWNLKSQGKVVHRMDVLVYINNFSVPVISMIPGYIFWGLVSTSIYEIYSILKSKNVGS